MLIKPQYTFSKRRKIFKFGRANWEQIKKSCSGISAYVMEQAKSSTTNIEQLWTYLKKNCWKLDKNVPSKMTRSKKSSPWINRNLAKQLKKSTLQKSKIKWQMGEIQTFLKGSQEKHW